MNFFEFASTWLLGILTVVIPDDRKAIAECRMTTLDLEKELYFLSKYSSGKAEDWFAERFRKIKDILRVLNAQHAGLFIKCTILQNLINKSLERIDLWEKDLYTHSPVHNVGAVKVDLLEIWGELEYGKELTKIPEVQKFLNSGLTKRTFIRFNLNIFN